MKKLCYGSLIFLAYWLSLSALAEVNDSAINVKWGYKGAIAPGRWSELDPAFSLCAKGKSQSPINIPSKTKSVPSSLKIHYTPAPLTLVNDGTTNLKLASTELVISDGHGLQVNFPQDRETITFNNKTYHLVQFHIHTPSETEWRGRDYPMEIHFVHQGEHGEVAVLAVLARGGDPNPEIEKMIDHLPQQKHEVNTVSGVMISPAALVPLRHGYYSFMGSLTTPPCLEGIQWIVLADSITLSPAQIVRLRQAIGGANARPVQRLHGRMVYHSENKI